MVTHACTLPAAPFFVFQPTDQAVATASYKAPPNPQKSPTGTQFPPCRPQNPKHMHLTTTRNGSEQHSTEAAHAPKRCRAGCCLASPYQKCSSTCMHYLLHLHSKPQPTTTPPTTCKPGCGKPCLVAAQPQDASPLAGTCRNLKT
jgi:hypothetical protein